MIRDRQVRGDKVSEQSSQTSREGQTNKMRGFNIFLAQRTLLTQQPTTAMNSIKFAFVATLSSEPSSLPKPVGGSKDDKVKIEQTRPVDVYHLMASKIGYEFTSK